MAAVLSLAERYELLVPEHPGFGESDDPPWIHSMSDLAMSSMCQPARHSTITAR